VDPDEGQEESAMQEGCCSEGEEKAWVLWDLARPLEGDCELKLLSWEDKEAHVVFWHSSAHILGYGLEKQLGSRLCIGPPLENGFY